VDPVRRGWALSLLPGKRRKRCSPEGACRRNRLAPQLCPNGCSTTARRPRWAQVAETIALLLPQLALPEAELIERPLQSGWGSAAAIAAAEVHAQAEAVLSTGRVCSPARPSCSTSLLNRWPCGWVCHRTGDTGPLARCGPPRAEIASGSWWPGGASARRLRALLPADGGGGGAAIGPIPFFWPPPSIRPSWRVGIPAALAGEWKWERHPRQFDPPGRQQLFSGAVARSW